MLRYSILSRKKWFNAFLKKERAVVTFKLLVEEKLYPYINKDKTKERSTEARIRAWAWEKEWISLKPRPITEIGDSAKGD